MTRARLLLISLLCLLPSAAWAQSDLTQFQLTLPGTVAPRNTPSLRVHASTTEGHLTLAHGDIIASGGYKVAYTYSHTGRTQVSLSSVAMPIAGTVAPEVPAGVLYQRTPSKGSVIGLALASSAALTAGSATCEAVILNADGNANTTGFQVLIGVAGIPNTFGRTRYNAVTQARGLDPFDFLDAVGANISTSADFAPTTAVLACTVVVVY